MNRTTYRPANHVQRFIEPLDSPNRVFGHLQGNSPSSKPERGIVMRWLIGIAIWGLSAWVLFVCLESIFDPQTAAKRRGKPLPAQVRPAEPPPEIPEGKALPKAEFLVNDEKRAREPTAALVPVVWHDTGRESLVLTSTSSQGEKEVSAPVIKSVDNLKTVHREADSTPRKLSIRDRVVKEATTLDPSESAMAKAQYLKDKIVAQEAAMLDATKVLFTSLEAMKPGDFSDEIKSVDAMRKVIEKDRQLAQTVIDSYPRYRSAALDHKAMLGKAPDIFRAAADANKAYASSVKYAELKADYLFLAELWSKQSARFEKRAHSIDGEIASVDNAIDYLKSTCVFLERLDAHLAAYPELATGAAFQEYCAKLRAYIRGFDDLRRALRKFGAKVGDEATNTTIQTEAHEMVAHDEAIYPLKPNARPTYAKNSNDWK